MSALCSRPDCGGRLKARGLCVRHYQEWYRCEGHTAAAPKPARPRVTHRDHLDDLPDDWTHNASCKGMDTSILFFPHEGRFGHIGRTGDAARAICARCPVQPACLTYAVRARLTDGIWGGLDPAERREVIRRAR